jgi:hypothetical protein
MSLIDSDNIKNKSIKEIKNIVLKNGISPEYTVRSHFTSMSLLAYLSDPSEYSKWSEGCYHVLKYDLIELFTFIEHLLINGANPNEYYKHSSDPLLFNYVLHHDLKNKNSKYTKLLLKYGADPNLKNKFYNNTILFKCVINTSNFIDVKPIVKTLIDYGAKLTTLNSEYEFKTFEKFNIQEGIHTYRNHFYDNYNENIKHTDNIFERLWKDLELATKKRRVKKFLLRYVVLNPKSKYIQRIVNEFN